MYINVTAEFEVAIIHTPNYLQEAFGGIDLSEDKDAALNMRLVCWY